MLSETRIKNSYTLTASAWGINEREKYFIDPFHMSNTKIISINIFVSYIKMEVTTIKNYNKGEPHKYQIKCREIPIFV